MKFAELLVDEIADGLQQPSADDIEAELVVWVRSNTCAELLPSEWKEIATSPPSDSFSVNRP